MDERYELRNELEQELQWVLYRQKMLDIMEKKLFQMKEIAEQVKHCNLTDEEIVELNAKLNNLLAQIKALDSESARTVDGIIFK